MIIPEIDLDRVIVKHPKRYDTYMGGKIAYADDKLFIDLPGVHLISCKDVNETAYYKFKLSKEQERFMFDLEDRLLALTIDNIDSWFKSKMNRETVDEYFQSCMTYHRRLRCVMKIRAENPTCIPGKELIGRPVDIKLRVASLKFLKTAFWTCYDVVECVSTRAHVFQGDDDDDAASLVGVGYDDELFGPDQEEIERLRADYIETLAREISTCDQRLNNMRKLLGDLSENNFSLATFDAVENAIA